MNISDDDNLISDDNLKYDTYRQKFKEIESIVKERTNIIKYVCHIDHMMNDATKYNLVNEVELALTMPEITSEGVNTSLDIACYHGYHQIFNMLFDDVRCDPSNYMNRPLLRAIQGNQLRIVKILLNDTRVIQYLNNHDCHCFLLAASNTPDILTLLSEKGYKLLASF